VSASNAAYADQFAGSDWGFPAPQTLQRAQTKSKITERPSVSQALSGLLGSQHFYDNDKTVEIVSLNDEGGKPALCRTFLGDYTYTYINTFLPKQGTDEMKPALEPLIELLQKEYVFEDRSRVTSFLEDRPSLPQVLLEAVAHLKDSFGTHVTFQLQLPLEEDLPVAIYAVALWKESLQQARTALQHFDDSWWNESSKRASGRIVFDYQLV
jgi:hypothetical protein